MKNKGFTLIELLVVMTIIAVLVGLSLTSYQSARKSARDGKRKSDLEQIRSALEMYRSDNDASYPDALNDLSDEGYITVIPSDPLSTSNYAYSSSSSSYGLCASLELGGSIANPSCAGLSCGGVCNYYTTSP
ncbi:MAG: type II secretion system protein [Patescibacteria group bacterium]|nr:type II secretion system GspH family protein [Patescibacteria group bacterium]